MADGFVTCLVNGVPTTRSLVDNVEIFGCVPGKLALGDAVYPVNKDMVTKASSLYPKQTCIGVVTRLLDTKRCEVVTHGIIKSYGIDLEPGATYYLSVHSGRLTSRPPTKRGQRVQVVGVAVSTTDLFVCPDPQSYVNARDLKEDDECYDVRWNPSKSRFELG